MTERCARSRMVIFSGGASKARDEDLLAEIQAEIQAVIDGGGFGSIIGRNTFQRSEARVRVLLGASGRAFRFTMTASRLGWVRD